MATIDARTAGGIGLADAWKDVHHAETNQSHGKDPVVDPVWNTVAN